MSTWQDLAGILNYLLTTGTQNLPILVFMLVGYYKLIKRIDGVENRLGKRIDNVEGRLTNVEGQVVTLQTQFREHELQCGERWGQVQRDLGAIRSSGGTADKSGQD